MYKRQIVRFAKETGTSVFIVGHVTKEGSLAGPRVLEHMVDAVLYFCLLYTSYPSIVMENGTFHIFYTSNRRTFIEAILEPT